MGKETTNIIEPINNKIQVKVFDPEANRVVRMSEDDYSTARSNRPKLTRAIPPHVNAGQPVYDRDTEINHLIKTGLGRIQAWKDGYGDQSQIDQAVLYAPDPLSLTSELLLDLALSYEGSNRGRSEMLFGLAASLEAKRLHQAKREAKPDDEWDPMSSIESIMPSIQETVLSSGIKFGEHAEQLAETRAEAKVRQALLRIDTPFTDIVGGIKDSLTVNRETKVKQLANTHNPDDRFDLMWDIQAIDRNLVLCDRYIERRVDYGIAEAVSREFTGEIQERIAQIQAANPDSAQELIEGPEAELQAIASLKDQLREIKRHRDNAVIYIYGYPDKPNSGLVNETTADRKKRLSETLAEDGFPLITVDSAQRLGSWIEGQLTKQGRPIETTQELLDLYKEDLWEHVVLSDMTVEERKLDPELGALVNVSADYLQELLDELKDSDPEADIDRNGLGKFISRSYISSALDTREDEIKGKLMYHLVPILEQYSGLNIRQRYDDIIDEIAHEAEPSDYVSVEYAAQHQAIVRELGYHLKYTLEYLNVPVDQRGSFVKEHKADLIAAILAYHEITAYANDRHLNERSVLESLAEAKFYNRPVSLQIVRCLRWCYPNKEVEIAPHAGDYPTFKADGTPILRHGWVEEEKLRIYRRAVVEPVLHHGIPVRDITLIATGDYEVVGEGYDFPNDHPEAANARSYVRDVRDRVGTWGIFNDLPVKVISFREQIGEFGTERFEDILGQVKVGYDHLFEDNSARYMGYSAASLERVIDAQHQHRIPFISWWERSNSRRFTRHAATFGIAFGHVISAQEGPTLLTVSGNQAAAKDFSHGHQVVPGTRTLGITLLRSVNDGDQPELVKQTTDVVE